ncbi:UNVERIFIED_CONTAM: hypothetical protein FKN15_076514 [Acipenser sinensis]
MFFRRLETKLHLEKDEVMMRILHKYWHFQHSRVQQHRVIWMLLQPAAATSNDDTASRHLFIAICLTAGIKISTGSIALALVLLWVREANPAGTVSPHRATANPAGWVSSEIKGGHLQGWPLSSRVRLREPQQLPQESSLLPSYETVQIADWAYAKFAGAPLKVHKIANPWRSPTGSLPALKTSEDGSLSQPHKIIIHLRKQIYAFWVDSKNYVEVTRRWYAENIPFPLNFYLPTRMHSHALDRLRLVRGDSGLEPGDEAEKELYRDAYECMTLLSQRLGTQKFFFGDFPSSLDAYVFGQLAPLLKVKLPNCKLQQHLKSLDNLCHYCSHILDLYFQNEASDGPARKAPTPREDGSDFDNEPHKRRNQFLSVLVALGAMVGYAFLTGIVSIQRSDPHNALHGRRAPQLAGDEVDDEDGE